MKSINGNNKNDRNINKAKKYFEIDFQVKSNKFFKIKDQNKQKNTYVCSNWKIVKNGELIVIDPINSEKPFFVKSWAAIVTNNNEVVWQPYSENDKKRLATLAIGNDDVLSLSEMDREILVNRKHAFANQQ